VTIYLLWLLKREKEMIARKHFPTHSIATDIEC
jgi:hypothetical protein